ncbi:VWA domain-containing protein, partial [Candidatus Woesearchaeota archaeon]
MLTILFSLLLVLFLWPKNLDQSPKHCECLGFETAEQCYGVIKTCSYQQVSYSDSGSKTYKTKKPVELFLVIDSSKTMRGAPLEEAKDAVNYLITNLSGSDRASIIVFNDKAQIVQPLSSSFSSSEVLERIQARGTTRYIPALELVKQEIVTHSLPSARKAVIFLSDGQPDDEGKPQSVWEKTNELVDLGVCFYTVGFNIPEESIAERTLKGMQNSSRQALGCGGYFSNIGDSRNLKSIMAEIYEIATERRPAPAILIPQPQSTYNTTRVPVKFENINGKKCYYSLNGLSRQEIFKTSFNLTAQEGSNLLTLFCGGSEAARTIFYVDTGKNLISRMREVLSQFEKGAPLELSDEETKKVLLRVFLEQNVSPKAAQTFADLLLEKNKKAADSPSVKRKISESDGKSRVTTSLETSAKLKDFTIYLDIPKCMAEKLNELVFSNENFQVISDDPLIMWHFAELSGNIDLSFEVLKEIEALCEEELKAVPLVSSTGEAHSGFLFRNLLPILSIPFIIWIVMISKKETEILASRERKGSVWLFIVLVLLLVLFYPKPVQKESPSGIRTCHCFGLEQNPVCFGFTYSCKDTQVFTPLDEAGMLECSASSCSTIENYLLLDDEGNPSFMDLDITFVLDRSGSMKGERMTNAKKALKGLIDNLGDDDRISLVRFDHSAQLALPFTLDKETAKQAVEEIKIGGRTKYIPALDVALENQLSNPSDRKPVIIFVSDGEPDDEGRP